MKNGYGFKAQRMVRQCPHCKSKKGFNITYSITGNGEMNMNFRGKQLPGSHRETFDRLDNYAQCLNCGKYIDSELLQKD